MKRAIRLALTASFALAIAAVGSAGYAAGDWTTGARRLMTGVPCKAAEVAETGTSSNLKTLAQQPLSPELEIGEIDVNKGLLLAQIFNPGGGFVAADVSNPLQPRLLTVFKTEQWTNDVKMTEDANTALLGLSDNGAGIAVVDIRNPAKPRVTDVWMSERPGVNQNAHMLFTTRIKNADWVFLAPNDSTGVWILKLVGPPGNKKIEFVTESMLGEGGPLGPHDMYVRFDDLLETWVLYVADGFEGWLAYDVGDPAAPAQIGGFFRPSSGYTHTIQAEMIAGRRIVTTVEEVGANLLKVYDATDLSEPVLLGVWHTRQGAGPAEAQHNLQIVQNRLYMAHYEQGVYVFDLAKVAKDATPLTSELVPVAHYGPETAPKFWDVVLEDGLLYTSRFMPGGGFDVVGFGCLQPGDRSLTSTG